MRSRLWFIVPLALVIAPVYYSSTYRDLLDQHKYSIISFAHEASHPIKLLSSVARNIQEIWDR